MNVKVKTIPIDAEWLDRLRRSGYTRDSVFEDGSQEEMKKRLLDIGGEAVCLRGVEIDYDNIMARGQLWDNPKIQMQQGIACECHKNSAKYWDANRDKAFICTGYGLSDDGVWRQHSWCYNFVTSKIVETTEERVAYYGFILDEAESEDFLFHNH